MEYFILKEELGKPVIRKQIMLKESKNIPYWVDMDMVDKEKNQKELFSKKTHAEGVIITM